MRIARELCGAALLILGAGAMLATQAAPATQVLKVAGAELEFGFAAEDFRDGAEPLLDWARRAATIVGDYYSQFPVPSLTLEVRAVAGSGVHGGRTEGGRRPEIRVQLGREVTAAELMRDWVLVHEMAHLALPEVGEEHAWLSEGLATYVEGIARTQAGNMSAAELWQEYLGSMPKGMPLAGDAGLDHTHTWARTYWGGALWCLLADVTIRERTHNRVGLQDALRAVVRDSGGLRNSWPIERVFAVGDRATGTTVLTELYMQMRDHPAPPDLPALWRRLGIDEVDGAMRLATGTSAAAVREAITRAPLRS